MLNLQCYLVGLPDIILVAYGDIVALGTAHSRKEVGIDTMLLTLMAIHLHTGIELSIVVKYRHGSVGRAIVLNNDFFQRIGLRQHTVHLLSQEP